MNCVTKCSFIFSFLIFNILSVFSQTSNFNWAVQGGGPSNDNAYAVDDLGNIYVAGNIVYESEFIDTTVNAGFLDIFITKLKSNGAPQWVKLAGGSEFIRHGLLINFQRQKRCYYRNKMLIR